MKKLRMISSSNKEDQQIRQVFAGKELQPSESTWDAIERRLIHKMAIKNRRKILFLQLTSAASFLCIISISIYLLLMNNSIQNLEKNLSQKVTKQYNTLKNKRQTTVDNPVKKTKPISERKTTHVTHSSRHKQSKISNPQNIALNKITDKQITTSTKSASYSSSIVTTTKEKEPINNTLNDNINRLPTNQLLKLTAVALPLEINPKKQPVISIKELEIDQSKLLSARSMKKQWWISSVLSPDYNKQLSAQRERSSSEIFYANAQSDNNPKSISEYTNAFGPRIGFTTGLQLGYQISEKWEFKSGLLYADKSEMGLFYQKNPTTFSPDMSTVLANLNDGSLIPAPISNIQDYEKVKIINKYEYLDIPITVQYFIGKKKLRFLISSGISTSILLNNNVIVNYSSQNERNKISNKHTFNIKNIFFNAQAGTGIDYLFKKKWSLRFQPTFRYGLLSLAESSFYRQFPYSFGLLSGVKFHF